jgi:hypothetical protein
MLCAVLLSLGASAQFTHPMLFEINSPAGITGSYNYGPQSGAGWGITALPTPTVSGELVWGYDITPDSLVCDTITNDYTGKIVMVRRGVCNFSQKMYYAQQSGAVGCIVCNNQGGTAIINMAAGTFGAQITIPAVSLSENDCALIAAAIANGDIVNGAFRKPYVSEAVGFFAVETPKAQIYPHDSLMSLDVTNAGNVAASNILVSLDITEPSGTVVSFTETLASLDVDSTKTVTYNSNYSPSDVGTYSMVFKSSLSSDSIVKNFEIGTNRFRLDRDQNIAWATITDANYSAAGFKVSIGSTYLTGANGGYAKSVTYAMGDNMARFIGKDLLVEIRAYPRVLTNATAVIDSFPIVAVGINTIDPTDTAAYSIQTVNILDVNSLEDSTLLAANSQYLVMIKYVRPAGDTLSVAPRFGFSGDEPFISYGTVVLSDQLYLGGFGGSNVVARLNTNDVVSSPTAIQNIVERSQFELMPNPADKLLNVNMNLDVLSENVTITLFDINGRIIEQSNYSNVKDQSVQLNVENLNAGFYFVRIKTDNGVQTKEFVKK